MAGTRRNELLAQLDKVKNDPLAASGLPRKQNTLKNQRGSMRKGAFSGTQVCLDDQLELWVGRSDWQNDDLVRLSSPHDLWIHLRDYAGAHGVIRGPKKERPS